MKKAEEAQQGGKTGGVREMGEKGRNKTKNHLLQMLSAQQLVSISCYHAVIILQTRKTEPTNRSVALIVNPLVIKRIYSCTISSKYVTDLPIHCRILGACEKRCSCPGALVGFLEWGPRTSWVHVLLFYYTL